MSGTFEQDKQQEARDAQIASQTDAFQRWLSKAHPSIKFCTALLNEIKAYMLDAFLTAGPEDFEYVIQNIDTQGLRQHVPTDDETKQILIAKILERLQSTNNRHWEDAHNVQTERTKMSFWSLEQLTVRLDGIIRAQTLSAKPPVELKQIVESGRRYVGYPQLGKTVVPPGQVTAVPQDAAYLKSLDAWEIKKKIRLFGIEQINSRLAGKE
jgi:hypothetical protein